MLAMHETSIQLSLSTAQLALINFLTHSYRERTVVTVQNIQMKLRNFLVFHYLVRRLQWPEATMRGDSGHAAIS